MLKKMLKGVLAIAAVCAMSSAAYADSSVGANITTTWSMLDGQAHTEWSGMIMGNMSGEKTSAMIWANDNEAGDFTNFFMNAGWQVADSVKLSVGALAVPGSTGYVTDGGAHPGAGNYSYFGSHLLVGNWVFNQAGIHAAIGMGDSNIYAGILDDAVGTSMTPYVYYGGMFGSINLTVGAVMNAGADTGMLVAFKMALGDSMDLAVDYHMQGSESCPAVSLNMKNLGPGNFGIAMSMPTTASQLPGYADSNIFVNYGISLEPGATLDLYVVSSGMTDFGMGLSKAF